jgi:1,4-alpha-glucan branching enzyme
VSGGRDGASTRPQPAGLARERPSSGRSEDGVVALVLHSHMPYVEGFGTWPFGEEWLWEAVATVYLPLLDLLDGAPVTLGLTPVLCDQLETLTGAAGDRLLAFLRGTRAPIHAEDAIGLERGGEGAAAREVRRAAGDYVAAERAFERLAGDVLGAVRRLEGPELITSAATHAILPLLATGGGKRLQVEAGIAAHELRFGRRPGVFWLPECAYEPGLEAVLGEQDVRAFCVDQTDALGLGAPEHLEPVATPAGPTAVPIDWSTVRLVWDERSGYPAGPRYRNYHGRTIHDLKPWENAGGAYDEAAARRAAARDARDFLRRAASRLGRYRAERGRPGLLCCPLDTELLGHWWYEGQAWLATVLAEAPALGIELLPLSRALERVEPVGDRELAASSWGVPKDLTTWDSPRVADLAVEARRGELAVVAASRAALGARGGVGLDGDGDAGLARATRELLALQSSDWAFQITRELAAEYPVERARGHARELHAALAAAMADSGAEPDSRVRNLAPELDLRPLLAP